MVGTAVSRAFVHIGWQLELFNGWHLHHGARTIEMAPREQRLVALLALEREGRPRRYLAGTLWPESDEKHAAASLRECVNRVQHAAPGLLAMADGNVALADGVDVDVDRLHAAAERVLENVSIADARAALNQFRRAELLPGWYEDWVLFERERIEELRLRGLETLAESHIGEDHGLALAAAQFAIRIDPLRERAHRAVMKVHLTDGNPTAAVLHFRNYASRLKEEIGLPPSPELGELIQPILSRQERAIESAVVSVRPTHGEADRRAPLAGEPWPTIRLAAQAIVDHLSHRYPVDLWLVTRLTRGRLVVVASAGTWAHQAHPGASIEEAQSLCARMVANGGPYIARDTTAVAAYAEIRSGPFARVRSYLGYPILSGSHPYGTIAAFSSAPAAPPLLAAEGEATLFAHLLSTVLTGPSGGGSAAVPPGAGVVHADHRPRMRRPHPPSSQPTTPLAS